MGGIIDTTLLAEAADTRRRSVLVVDDDQAICRLLRRNLEGSGASVVEATNGVDCVRMLRENRVDLVLLDLRLPDFSGWGILSLLRLTEPLQDMPVIVVSVEPPDRALIDRLRPNDYIRKPFDMSDLLARVKKVMQLKRERATA